jgi:hypothetical protein
LSGRAAVGKLGFFARSAPPNPLKAVVAGLTAIKDGELAVAHCSTNLADMGELRRRIDGRE